MSSALRGMDAAARIGLAESAMRAPQGASRRTATGQAP